MKKIDKRVWYALPIVLGGYLIYRQFAKVKTPETSSNESNNNTNTNSGGNTNNTQTSNYPLKKGSKDAGAPNNPSGLVVELQRLINAYGGYRPKLGYLISLPIRLTQDGIYGANTEWAVEQYLGKKTVDNRADLLALEQKIIQKQSQNILTNPNLKF